MNLIVRLLLILTLLAGLSCVSAQPALAQDGDDANVVDDQSRDDADTETGQDETADAEAEVGAVEDAEVPETFDPLYEEFRTLVGEIRAEGGNPAVKFEECGDLLERVQAYHNHADRTPTELGLAVELQLITWTNQFVASEELFDRFEEIEITHPGLRIAWADHLRQNDFAYEEALDVLDAVEIDLSRYPLAAVIRAQTLVQMNQYEDAAATLDAIPADAPRTPELLDSIYRVRRDIENAGEDWAREQATLDAEAQADDLPRVEFTTAKGAFTIELFENEAPNTVANFIALVEEGFYNGLKFHQVSPNMQVAMGDPKMRATSGVTDAEAFDVDFTIDDEIPAEGGRLNWTGYVSMLRPTGPDTGSTQLRIALRRLAHLDGTVTVFGRVVDGMRVVRNIERDDEILAAEVIRKRDHDYEVARNRAADDGVGDATGVDDQPENATTDDTAGESTGDGDGDATTEESDAASDDGA